MNVAPLLTPALAAESDASLQLGEPAGDREPKPEPADASIRPLLLLCKRFKQFARELLVESNSGVSDRYNCVPCFLCQR